MLVVEWFFGNGEIGFVNFVYVCFVGGDVGEGEIGYDWVGSVDFVVVIKVIDFWSVEVDGFFDVVKV